MSDNKEVQRDESMPLIDRQLPKELSSDSTNDPLLNKRLYKRNQSAKTDLKRAKHSFNSTDTQLFNGPDKRKGHSQSFTHFDANHGNRDQPWTQTVDSPLISKSRSVYSDSDISAFCGTGHNGHESPTSPQALEMSNNCVRKSVTVANDGHNPSRFQVAKVSDEDNGDTIHDMPTIGQHMSIDYSNTYYDTKNLKSLRHYTREALPRVDNYRNILSVHRHMTRPTLDELHGVQTTIHPEPKVKASIRTFNPRETKFIKPEQRFKRIVFIRNVTRLKTLIMEIYEILKLMNSCFQWESVSRSIIALTMFLVVTYFFELYMAPIVILLLFIKSYIWIKVENHFNQNNREEETDDLSDNAFDDDDDETKSEEKKSLKEKLQTVQEITTIIQNVIGDIASAGERIKNTFNFSVPFLSWLAIICLSIITIILYYIPLRYLIMVWGINKFTKKLRSPNAINNNELLDFLSRVPDVDEKITFKEYRVHTNTQITNIDGDRKKKKKVV